MEPVKHEGGKPFLIKNWWWEPGVSVTKKIKEAVSNGLERFAGYLGADGVDRGSAGKVW